MMGPLDFATIAAFYRAFQGQGVMRTPHVAPRPAGSFLGNGHDYS
jgi:hypothetical protein